jgi:hypothetical protein
MPILTAYGGNGVTGITENGERLRVAEQSGFDVMVTSDQNIPL